jgi:hypothetical protein
VLMVATELAVPRIDFMLVNFGAVCLTPRIPKLRNRLKMSSKQRRMPCMKIPSPFINNRMKLSEPSLCSTPQFKPYEYFAGCSSGKYWRRKIRKRDLPAAPVVGVQLGRHHPVPTDKDRLNDIYGELTRRQREPEFTDTIIFLDDECCLKSRDLKDR